MKKQLLFILFLICFSLQAQIKFEKGYYINNQNVKNEVLIKNIDWYNNPKDFIYKISENSPEKTGNLTNVKEFAVNGESKFVRATVKIDKSTDNLQRLDIMDTEPKWITETQFLRVLSEGKVNLYQFKDDRFERFFYSKPGTDIEQLVYKMYLTEHQEVYANLLYRIQLRNAMEDKPELIADIEATPYKKAPLLKIFNMYNGVGDTENSAEFKSLNKKIDFNLYVRPGINSSNLSISRIEPFDNTMDTDFPNKTSFRFGVEAEFVLPFNKNKFALILEPTYFSYKQTGTTRFGRDASVDYSGIELPAGLRYYIFMNDHSKLFFDASFIFKTFEMNKKLSVGSAYDNYPTNLDILSSNNFAVGVGYNYKDKYSLELRTYTNRTIMTYVYWNSHYQTTSLIFGYNIF